MARKTTIVKTEEEAPQAAPLESDGMPAYLEPPEEDEPDPNSLEAWKQGFTQETILKVLKRDRWNGRLAFVGSTTPAGFSEEWLQATHGPGDYQIQAFLNGRYAKGGTRSMTIGEPAKPSAPAPAPAQSAAPPSDFFTMQLEMMREEMKLQREILMKSLERDKPESNLGEILASVVSIAKTLIPPAPPPPVNPLASMDSLIGILQKGIEIGQTGTAEDKKGGVMGWIKDLAPIAGEVLTNMLPQRQTAPAPHAAPAPNAAPELPAPQAEAEAQAKAIAMLRAGLSYLKAKAVRGADPGIYVDFVSDNLDDPQWTPLFKLLDKPYDDIARAIDPELLELPYRPWFETLFSGIKEVVGGSDDGTIIEPAAGETGDGSKPESNVRPFAPVGNDGGLPGKDD